MEAYKQISKDARLKVLDLVYKAQTSHIGSNFSCIDILSVLFDKIDFDKDKFILSKGWAAASLYYFLYTKGRITEEELDSYCKDGSDFIGLAEPIHPDIPIAGGSMGLGFPMAVGIALAKKMNNEDGRVYVLMSDGEMDCGTTWEAALIAGHHNLNNLVVIVDDNGYQAMGSKKDILDSAFPNRNWTVLRIDGHDFDMIERAIESTKNSVRPTCFIAQTVKGKGVSFMENNNIWHYKAPNKDEYNNAKQELCQI